MDRLFNRLLEQLKNPMNRILNCGSDRSSDIDITIHEDRSISVATSIEHDCSVSVQSIVDAEDGLQHILINIGSGYGIIKA